MEFTKNHPLFFAAVSISGIGLLAGLIFAVIAFLDLGNASKLADREERNFIKLINSSPTPSDANVAISNTNVLELSNKLASMREELERGTKVDPSLDGVQVTAGIQQYISKFKALAANHEDENGPLAINIPEGFAFGFDRFKLESTVPEDPSEISLLDKQRDILDFLMTELFATNPQGITSVKREVARVISEEEAFEVSDDPSIFKISSSVSSSVEGAIDTIAFEIGFKGKTQSLREYLNRLAQFERPIVVRSINVTRPNESVKVKSKEKSKKSRLLESFGEEIQSLEEDMRKDPVVTDNVSEFSITLEYIEVVLPENSSEDES